MDPFEELTGLSARSKQFDQRPLSSVAHQQSSGASAPASQLTPNMSALPSMARGNPFVDIPPKVTAAPTRARAGPSGAFQVLPCILPACALALGQSKQCSITMQHISSAGPDANRLFWSQLQ